MKAEKVVHFDPPLKLGEGPIYRAEDHTLHFNDLVSKKVHIVPINPKTGQLDPSRKQIEHDTADNVTVQYFRDGRPGYICLFHQGIGLLDEETGELQTLKQLHIERESVRMNDGTVDPQGRFWGGELDFAAAALGTDYQAQYEKEGKQPKGRLWRLGLDGEVEVVLDGGLAISNGIGFSPDHTEMYLNDSLAQRTYAFDYDNNSGNISNQRIVKDFRGTPYEPDGLVVDVKGNIWTALYNGSAILCLSPKGETLAKVELPAKLVTCPTWGGENNDILFVTTAGGENPEHDGHVYAIKTNTKGMLNYKSKN